MPHLNYQAMLNFIEGLAAFFMVSILAWALLSEFRRAIQTLRGWQRALGKRLMEAKIKREARNQKKKANKEQEEKEASNGRQQHSRAKNEKERSKATSSSLQWWEILEVGADASMEEIKRAYRTKVRQYHPDRLGGLAPELVTIAEQRTKELNQAFATAKARART